MKDRIRSILNKTASYATPEMVSLLDALPFYVLLVDEGHRILFANDAVRTQLGLDPQTIRGGYCPAVVHGKNGPVPECPLEESRDKNCAVEREVYDKKSGQWLLSSIYPTELRTEKGSRVFFHMVHNITKRKTAERELRESLAKMQSITEAGLNAISLIVEKRDPYTAGHQAKVGNLAHAIATTMGYDERFARGIRIAGLLHDVGKIAVPIEILSKPGIISEDEFRMIQHHPEAGHSILKDIELDWPVAEAILQHHERLNGSGYPRGLREDMISMEARIIAVADVFEAMTSHLPYRPALSVEEAFRELISNKGILYDPAAVDACMAAAASLKQNQ